MEKIEDSTLKKWKEDYEKIEKENIKKYEPKEGKSDEFVSVFSKIWYLPKGEHE